MDKKYAKCPDMKVFQFCLFQKGFSDARDQSSQSFDGLLRKVKYKVLSMNNE